MPTLKPRKPLPRATKPLKRTPLPRATKPIRKSKYHHQVTVGKLGIVRLKGKALKELRRQCFERDHFKCVDCGDPVVWSGVDTWGYQLAVGEMSHVHAKRNNGDTLENVVTRCQNCHSKSHNAGGQPLPRKPR